MEVHLQKLLNYRAVLVAACVSLLAGCAGWEPTARWKDPPFAYGVKAQPVSRSFSCAFCPTGRSGESAFLVKGRAFDIDEIAIEAAQLVRHSAGLTWTAVEKDYDGQDRLFAPVRIIVLSMEPLVVLTIPWPYVTKPGYRTPFYVADGQLRAFEERENEFGPQFRYIPQAWPKGYYMAVEFRGSIPKEATSGRLFSRNSAMDLTFPQGPAPTAVTVDGQRMTFARSGAGTILVNFSPKER